MAKRTRLKRCIRCVVTALVALPLAAGLLFLCAALRHSKVEGLPVFSADNLRGSVWVFFVGLLVGALAVLGLYLEQREVERENNDG